ncbi:hypothetical protein B1T50_01865 [Mycobacterium kansasii]|nr:hypothetical protein B1T50_01865 [Mycobacterium kansasii]
MVHDTITGADGDKFLQNITHHYWKDNGQGVGSLFSWTGDPAVVQGPEEGIAAETAHVYSSYIGTDQELLHLPGNHTLGQVNPNLVRDMAHGLGPYVNNIAGTSGGLPGFGDPLDGHTMSGALPVAKGVLASIILTVCLAPVGCGSNVGEKASGTTSSSAKSSASFAPPPPSINAPDRAHRKSSGVLAEIPHL